MTEIIEELVEWIGPERRHHHHNYDRRIFTLMTTQAAPFVLTGTAQYPDPANPGQFLDDPNAKGEWSEDSGGVGCTIADQGTVGGVSTLAVTPSTVLTADMVVTITGFAADPDGHATPTATYVFTVPAAPVVTDATQFVISDGSAPAAGTAAGAAAGQPGTNPTALAAQAAAATPATAASTPPTVEEINAADAAKNPAPVVPAA